MITFDVEKLIDLAEKNSGKYKSAQPFPYIYFDDFFPERVIESVYRDFPQDHSSVWNARYNDEYQYKLACENPMLFPGSIWEILQECNSSVFVGFLEKLTGIQGLIPDPYYRGGGMHQILPGGFLKVHVDFNWHPRLKLERRVNVLIYLNKDWREEYGGYFELWNKDMTKSEVKILPIFNRIAIFSTSENSYHGHPDPLACPAGMSRKSLALYYYTSPATEDQIGASAHSTVFKGRPGEHIVRKNNFWALIKKITPNALLSVGKRVRKIFK